MDDVFTREEALTLWARLVAGWARSLDPSGARTLMAGVPNAADAGGSYEGVTRMLWGLGGWLSHGGRPSAVRWRGETFDTAALMRQAVVAGCDPRSLGYWGRGPTRGEYDQRTVESAQVAFALWQTRERVWAALRDAERANIFTWLDRFGRPPSHWRNNWALFWVLNHAGRKGLGMPYDQAVIDSALEYLDRVYCGDGWYDDGPQRGVHHFDDYNWWVFGTHVMAWAECDGPSRPVRQVELLDRVPQSMTHFPYLFGADGAYTEYGRSLSYKFARLGAALWAYKLGVWPHSVGLLRRLVGRHLHWYADRGAIRADGTLRQRLTAEGSQEIREPYIATGSAYWAMLAFNALWSLSDDDPLWRTEEQPLPVEQGDYAHVWPEPGWVVVGTQASGAVQRFNAGSQHEPAKYGKFVYSTVAPFNVGLVDGQPAPDGMLCLTNGQQISHRNATLASAVGRWPSEGLAAGAWLRMRYQQHVGGVAHTIDTTIVVRGELHLRAHRVTLHSEAGPVGAVEGPAALGYSSGEVPSIDGSEDGGWEIASVGERSVAIRRLRGYDGQSRAAAWRGRHDLNSVYGHYVLPALSVSRVEPVQELVCVVHIGEAGASLSAFKSGAFEATWSADGVCLVTWSGGMRVEVPPP